MGAHRGPGGGRGAGAHSTRSDAEPPEQLHRQVGEQERQPAHVVAGVEHDQDVRVTVAVLPGLAQPADQLPHLGGGHLGGVVRRGPTGPRPGPRSTTCVRVRARR